MDISYQDSLLTPSLLLEWPPEVSVAGYAIIFDTNISGTVYTVTNEVTPSTESATKVESGKSVLMNGTDVRGQVRLYTVQPEVSTALSPKKPDSNVPMINSDTVLTQLADDIIMYSVVDGSVTFHRYNTNLNRWTGLDLVSQPTSPPVNPTSSAGSQPGFHDPDPNPKSTSSKSPIGTIIGSIMGAVVLIGLIAALYYFCSRRKHSNTVGEASPENKTLPLKSSSLSSGL
ncbi:hypothetical protein BGW38_008452 [Lunasporangiospora selenospora]|uniref:Uncharacterized protein n=1 Tax=Lunasporangiospora selenospora TaxID=979761 RepID=A0A9P6KGG5_9FUNG|nr:hypothetical protein BGW38_008452 [Lunasporangiospora selenospora]